MLNKFTILLVVAFCATALAVCSKPCTKERDPVCGSDGVTYGNNCTLDCAAEENPDIEFVKNGECFKTGTRQGGGGICVCGVDSNCGNCGGGTVS